MSRVLLLASQTIRLPVQTLVLNLITLFLLTWNKGHNMENTKLTIWDWIGTALLGILLGSIFAYGFIC